MNSSTHDQGLRGLLHRYPIVATLGAAVMLIIAAVGLFGPDRPPAGAPRGAWYFDLATGERFADASGHITPFAIEEGAAKTAVRAVVFACGMCGDEEQYFVGWLEMYNPEKLERAEAHAGGSKAMTMLHLNESADGILIHAPEADASAADDMSQWTPRKSPAAERIMRQVQTRCSQGQRASRCEPQA